VIIYLGDYGTLFLQALAFHQLNAMMLGLITTQLIVTLATLKEGSGYTVWYESVYSFVSTERNEERWDRMPSVA
jgi:hypothetical protein